MNVEEAVVVVVHLCTVGGSAPRSENFGKRLHNKYPLVRDTLFSWNQPCFSWVFGLPQPLTHY